MPCLWWLRLSSIGFWRLRWAERAPSSPVRAAYRCRCLHLEGRSYQGFPELTCQALVSGQFQDEFDRYVTDSVPKLQGVMLANASLQRDTISLAVGPFAYTAYPTFYGSSYAYSADDGAVCMIPSRQYSDSTDYESITASLNSLAALHPDIRWRMALVDRASISEASPVHDLVAEPVDYSYLRELVLDPISGRIPYSDLANSVSEDYYKLYFRTDHHWQVWGALDAYSKVMESYGEEPMRFGEAIVGYDGPFYGSYARSGLCMLASDAVDDVAYDHSKLLVTFDGAKKHMDALSWSMVSDSKRYKKPNRFANVYGDYFHGDPTLIEITNTESEVGRSLLIIGDSFTNNCERFYAEHYDKVYVLDPRSYKGTISGFLDEHAVDDALFLLSRDTLVASSFQDVIR